MEFITSFIFEGKIHAAKCIVCNRQHPIYVYVSLEDKQLIREFGEELCIHIERSDLLTAHLTSDRMIEVHTAAFKGVKRMLEFSLVNDWQNSNATQAR